MKKLYFLAIILMCNHLVFAQAAEPASTECPQPKNYAGESYYEDGEFGARLAWDRAEYEYTLDRFEIYRSFENEDFIMVQRIVNTPSITHYECLDLVEKAGKYIYRILAFYQDDCVSDRLDVDVEVTDHAVVGESFTNNVTLYPNPASNVMNIKGEAMKNVTITNMMGQVVITQNIDNDEVVIDLGAFENGMYLVEVMTAQGGIVKIINVLR